MSIDPTKVTNFDRTDAELQEFFIYSVVVAGKQAKTISRQLDFVLNMMRDGCKGGNMSPLALLNFHTRDEIASLLKAGGIGCYNQRAEGLAQAAGLWVADRLDLRTCDVSDLEAIKWVGPKTARFFLLHSRRGVRVAAVDTHVLKHLAANGVKVPAAPPGKGNAYLRLEREFLALADKSGMTAADYDLMVWTSYSS